MARPRQPRPTPTAQRRRPTPTRPPASGSSAARGRRREARIKLELKGDTEREGSTSASASAPSAPSGPFVPNQEILAARQARRPTRSSASQSRSSAAARKSNIGRFDIRSPKVIKPGDYRVRANKLPTPEQQRALRCLARSRGRLPGPRPRRSRQSSSSSTSCSRRGLRQREGSSLRQRHRPRVLAFRKVNNMARTENANPATSRSSAGQGRLRAQVPRAPASTSRPTSRAR